MRAAIALSERGRGLSEPNPNVGCILVRDGRVVGRGWTQPGGRPHAESMAIDAAGSLARGATAYVTLEPCAHVSPRGPACADRLIESGIARVVIALTDPDARTNGAGAARLRAAGIAVVEGVEAEAARRAMSGFLIWQMLNRPEVTLKLALSLDGAVAMADGRSQWITGPQARAHAHVERARHGWIVVGSGTLAADRPRLDVRLPGLEERSPRRAVLGSSPAPEGWTHLARPQDVADLPGQRALVEGGALTAAAFLRADLVDRLLLYRAPILVGGGRTLDEIGLGALGEAHGRWRLHDARMLGVDRCEVYGRIR